MCGGDKEIMFIGEANKILPKLCPKCGKEMCPYHHYYVSDDKGEVIEICKKCLDKRTVHRMFVKVQGKTRVID